MNRQNLKEKINNFGFRKKYYPQDSILLALFGQTLGLCHLSLRCLVVDACLAMDDTRSFKVLLTVLFRACDC